MTESDWLTCNSCRHQCNPFICWAFPCGEGWNVLPQQNASQTLYKAFSWLNFNPMQLYVCWFSNKVWINPVHHCQCQGTSHKDAYLRMDENQCWLGGEWRLTDRKRVALHLFTNDSIVPFSWKNILMRHHHIEGSEVDRIFTILDPNFWSGNDSRLLGRGDWWDGQGNNYECSTRTKK